MQISYHSVPNKNSKITKNLKKKKKKKFYTGPYAQYQPLLPKIGRYGWYGQYLNWYETLMFRYRYSRYQYDIDYLGIYSIKKGAKTVSV